MGHLRVLNCSTAFVNAVSSENVNAGGWQKGQRFSLYRNETAS